ncbi:MAG: hypothetical protein WCV50_05510 [Patescibacteria group bacterium]|jgi:hypothetical protein
MTLAQLLAAAIIILMARAFIRHHRGHRSQWPGRFKAASIAFMDILLPDWRNIAINLTLVVVSALLLLFLVGGALQVFVAGA